MRKPRTPLKPVVPSAIFQMFAARPPPVQKLALSARQLLLATLPGAVEIPDEKASVVGYGFGPGYKHMVATLILSKAGIKIGFVQGVSLPDPASLLEGKGKVHCHIAVTTQEQLRRPEVTQLLEVGLSAWRKRSRSAKQRYDGNGIQPTALTRPIRCRHSTQHDEWCSCGPTA